MPLLQPQLLFLQACVHRRAPEEPLREALCRPLGFCHGGLSPWALCPHQLPPSPQILNPAFQLRVLCLGAHSQLRIPRTLSQWNAEQVWGSPRWLSASRVTLFPSLVSGVLQTISLYMVFVLTVGGGRGSPVSVTPSYMEVGVSYFLNSRFVLVPRCLFLEKLTHLWPSEETDMQSL